MMNADDLGLIKEFVVESIDLLDEAEPKLIGLQMARDLSAGVAPELINSVFRLFHSMKGTAGMLPLGNVARLTHEAETLLDLFRKGTAVFKPIHTDVLLRAMDLIRKILEHVDRELNDDGFEVVVQELVGELEVVIRKEKDEINAAKKQPISQTADDASVAEMPVTNPQVDMNTEASVSQPNVNPSTTPLPDELELMEVPITQEMIDKFVQESDDMLESFDQAMLTIEKNNDEETMKQAFRTIHSFKGNCSFMGLADLERLSHSMETVMDGMKTGTLEVNTEHTQILFNMTDILKAAVADLSKCGNGKIAEVDKYVRQLELIIHTQTSQEFAMIPEPNKVKTEKEIILLDEPVLGSGNGNENGSNAANTCQQQINKTVVRQDIRVDLHKLDILVNLVGELVISEAMMTRHPAIKNLKEEGVEKAIHQLRRVSQELQDIAMSVRMVPLSATFQKMIRLVHDLSRKSGKTVELELVGEETEVDKTVIEKISDPLVHLIRNAIDHGIETPEDRRAAGKSPMGKILLEGRHEGGEVWIIMRDDGRGLDRKRIIKKAQERGLAQDDANELTDKQVYKLIFEPGFSTADKLTDISGRGVGLDVVKKNLEKLKGRVDVQCQEGKGTTFILRIPLTLAIIEGMLVRVGNSRYTIPMLMIRESMRPGPQQIIVTPDGNELVRVRNEIIPIVRLHKVFKKKTDVEDLTQGILIILDMENQSIGLFVDEILEQHETVIKGLSDYLGSAHGISGCTILGNGDISLILDVNEIIALADEQNNEKSKEMSRDAILLNS